MRLNPERYSDQRACRHVRILVIGKVLQIPVISDHIDQKSRAFEVMSPSFESFKMQVALCHGHRS